MFLYILNNDEGQVLSERQWSVIREKTLILSHAHAAENLKSPSLDIFLRTSRPLRQAKRDTPDQQASLDRQPVQTRDPCVPR